MGTVPATYEQRLALELESLLAMGWNQFEMAARYNVSPRTIRRWLKKMPVHIAAHNAAEEDGG
jgi:hypothetical protein